MIMVYPSSVKKPVLILSWIRVLMYVLVICVFFNHNALAKTFDIVLSDEVIAKDYRFKGKSIEIKGKHTDLNELILIVSGPLASYEISKREKTFGVWVNHNKITLPAEYSYYYISSSKPIHTITSRELIDFLTLDLKHKRCSFEGEVSEEMQDDYCEQFIKYMQRRGLYAGIVHNLNLASDGTFSAMLELPADVPNGNYTVALYSLDAKGDMTEDTYTYFTVVSSDFYGMIRSFALNSSLWYSCVSILIAIFFGLASGFLFNRYYKKR